MFEQCKRKMDKSTPTVATETDTLREVYAALNRGDIDPTVEAFARQIVWIEPADYPRGGIYRGYAEAKAHLAQARSTWAEGGCEPERSVVVGDKHIVFIYVRVRLKLKSETEWREGRHAAAYTFRDGKAIELRIFDDHRQAVEWPVANASD